MRIGPVWIWLHQATSCSELAHGSAAQQAPWLCAQRAPRSPSAARRARSRDSAAAHHPLDHRQHTAVPGRRGQQSPWSEAPKTLRGWSACDPSGMISPASKVPRSHLSLYRTPCSSRFEYFAIESCTLASFTLTFASQDLTFALASVFIFAIFFHLLSRWDPRFAAPAIKCNRTT
jgi:hypothetical protein